MNEELLSLDMPREVASFKFLEAHVPRFVFFNGAFNSILLKIDDRQFFKTFI